MSNVFINQWKIGRDKTQTMESLAHKDMDSISFVIEYFRKLEEQTFSELHDAALWIDELKGAL